MKNKVLTSLLALAMGFTALPATTVLASETQGVAINEDNFPDEYFRAGVKKYDENDDDVLSVDEAAQVTKLYLGWPEEGEEISSVKGIEYFPELTYINLSANKVETLDLSKNTKLESVVVYNSGMKSINLDGCNRILALDLDKNALTSLDLSSLTNLESLSCSYNEISTLDLSNNAKLEDIEAIYNNLHELNIENLTNLQYIYVCQNYITSLDTSKNPNIEEVQYLAKETNLGTTEAVSFDAIPGFNEFISFFAGDDIKPEFLDQMFKTEGLIFDYENKTIQLEEGKTEGILSINVGDDMYESFKFFYKPAPKPEVKPDVKPEVKPETKPEVKPETKPEVKPENKPVQKVEKAETPKTGDTTNYMFLVSSFVVAGAAVLKLRKKVMD